MIRITKSFNDKSVKTDDLDEWDVPIHDQLVKTLEAMKENNCHTMIITIDEGLQVLYTIQEKK